MCSIVLETLIISTEQIYLIRLKELVIMKVRGIIPFVKFWESVMIIRRYSYDPDASERNLNAGFLKASVSLKFH